MELITIYPLKREKQTPSRKTNLHNPQRYEKGTSGDLSRLGA